MIRDGITCFHIFIIITVICAVICCGSNLWRAENQMQQKIASLRDELSKKDQALRSITGKVRSS